MNDEFYIGWEAKAPARIGSMVRWSVVALLIAALILAFALAAAQRTIGIASFQWSKLETFSGRLEADPYPHLLVARPNTSGDGETYSAYYLVAPYKFGLDRSALSSWDGQPITLRGTLIYRDTQTMIEVTPHSIQAATPSDTPTIPAPPANQPVSFGEHTFVGEIVDSKCYFGVMNPGISTPHRACAVRCISGGVPPVLLVRTDDGRAKYLLLVSRNGESVNKEVIDFAAEPIEITGELVQQDELLMLKSNPETYRRK